MPVRTRIQRIENKNKVAKTPGGEKIAGARHRNLVEY